jgi:hypothetical protein
MYKIIVRTLFYHWLLLCFGISIGFVVNAEWLGYKSVIIERSINNIFFPIEFSEDVENKVKQIGSSKIFTKLGSPSDFEILGEVVYYNDEFYWCKYKFRDSSGQLNFGEATTRVRWKTWEYNYSSEKELIDDEDKAAESIKRFEAWQSKIRDAIKQAEEKEKALREAEKVNNAVTT